MSKKLFLMTLASAVAVPAMVAPMAYNVEASTVQFKDIPKKSPYYEAVTEMVSKGIIFGYNDGTYKPQTEITRVQVAMLLARALPLEPVREAKQFKDVPKTYKHYDAIRKVQQAGIIDGAGNGNFNPEATLTRDQMAKILAIGFDLEVKGNDDFPDVPATHWANKYVRALYSNGITVGNNGKYEPAESVTRGQYAMFLHRLMNLDPNFEADPIPKPEQPGVKPEKPEKPVDPPVTTPDPDPEPEKPVDQPDKGTGLVTDKYPDLSEVPKPPTYVEGLWEDLYTQDLDKMIGKLGLKTKIEIPVDAPDEYINSIINTLSVVAKTDSKEVLRMMNDCIENGTIQSSEDYAMFYNYKKGKIIVAYNQSEQE